MTPRTLSQQDCETIPGACTVTHIGYFGSVVGGSFASDFDWAFERATEWVGKPGIGMGQCAIELRCDRTGTLYRIKPKSARGVVRSMLAASVERLAEGAR